MGKRWIMMPARDTAALLACEERHLSTGRGRFSVRKRLDGSQVVVKVAGADKAWRKAQPWMADIDGIWDESDHAKLLAIMAGPDWTEPMDDPGAEGGG